MYVCIYICIYSLYMYTYYAHIIKYQLLSNSLSLLPQNLTFYKHN